MSNALVMGASQQRNMHTKAGGWRSMASAPRNGTFVELKNTYGIAPSYCIARWTDENIATGSDEKRHQFKGQNKSWVKPEGGGPFCESSLQWRPYDGDAESYVDPTGGLQNSAAYWRGASAAKLGLPINFFEASVRERARDADAATRKWLDCEEPPPTRARSFIARLFGWS